MQCVTDKNQIDAQTERGGGILLSGTTPTMESGLQNVNATLDCNICHNEVTIMKQNNSLKNMNW